MVGIDKGFLPLSRKGEIVRGEPVDRHRAEVRRGREVRLPFARLLKLTRLFDVARSGFLVSFSRHLLPPELV